MRSLYNGTGVEPGGAGLIGREVHILLYEYFHGDKE